MNLFGLELVAFRDFMTFAPIATAESYSLKGKSYLGSTALKTYEGEPWEIMRANTMIYDFNKGVTKQISTVSEKLFLQSASQFYISNGLIVPGSLRDDGKRVTDYSARFLWDSNSFRYSEVICE